MSIRVRGPWMWVWGLNILALWGLAFFAGGAVAWGLSGRWPLLGAMAWLAWFFVQEGAGVYYADRAMRRGEPELARTFSQVMQFFAFRDKGSSFWQTLTGWDLFVTANCVMAGYVPGFAVAAYWGGAAGWLVGLGIFGWNYGHWHNRGRHG